MSELEILEMKPGILVTEIVKITGGVHYEREYQESYLDDKAEVREWKTISRIDNVKEREKAMRVRSRIYKLVQNECIKTPIGLVCNKEKEPALLEALQLARAERDKFNESALSCKVIAHHACFEVREDNYQTIAAIADQIAEVAKEVSLAITSDDETTLGSSARRWLKGMRPEAILLLPSQEKDAIIARVRAELIRKAIREINGVEKLLPKVAGDEAKTIIKKSRSIANELCAKVERKNQSLDDVLDEVDLGGIKRSRAAFAIASMKADDMMRPIQVAPSRTLELD